MEENYIETMRELTNKEKKIQDVIDLRRVVATEKKIMEKVIFIIEVLGDHDTSYNNNYSEYKDTVFILKLDSEYIKIDLNILPIEHDLVFEGYFECNRIDLYCPDSEWENHLETLYKKAKAKQKLDEVKEIIRRQERLIVDWKIMPEEIK